MTHKKIRIKFIISAWDRVEKKAKGEIITPEEYLKKELPLLYQYIRCNSEIMEYQFWGVSAQGVEFTDKNELSTIADQPQNKFVKVVDNYHNEYHNMSILLEE